MCIAQTPTPDRAASETILGSPSRLVTSLMISAPAWMAAWATADFEVSMEIGTAVCEESARITGNTRRSSSSASTGWEYGRVLSPPMSSRSAPWATSSSPWAIAAPESKNLPPSEKLSGVTLTIPIKSGRRPNAKARLRKVQ